jgi:hypothetical protein
MVRSKVALRELEGTGRQEHREKLRSDYKTWNKSRMMKTYMVPSL